MKQILAFLYLGLFPIIASAQTSEPELLSYTQEVEFKGATATQLYKWFCDWEQEYGTSFGIGVVEPNGDDNILKLHVTKYNINRGLHCYNLFFDIYALFQNGKYLLDLTNICVIDSNGWESYHKPIQKYQKCKTIRNILGLYFSDLQSSLSTDMQAHAEIELSPQ